MTDEDVKCAAQIGNTLYYLETYEEMGHDRFLT